MYYIIFATLVGITLPWIFITYNIARQWSQNFHKCMSEFPEHMRIKPSMKVKVTIPSWHITGHGVKCRKGFHLGYMKGAGRMCGEEVEISWSHTNLLAPSVWEMAPVAQHKTLNDHWNGWNFHKIVGFCKCDWFSFFVMKTHSSKGSIFVSCFQEAVVMSMKHKEAFDKLSLTFPSETVKKWVWMVECWEANPKALNPYEESENSKSLQLIWCLCLIWI